MFKHVQPEEDKIIFEEKVPVEPLHILRVEISTLDTVFII